MTWESIAQLPDFGGWWLWEFSDEDRFHGAEGKPITPPFPFAKAPIRPEIMPPPFRRIEPVLRHIAADRSALAPDASWFCHPPAFLGFNAAMDYGFEILFSPGRVTITDERGWCAA